MIRFIKTNRWLSSLVAGIFAFTIGTVAAQMVQRPLDPGTGKSAGISYFSSSAAPSAAADGELAIESQGVGSTSTLQFYDSASGADAWVVIPDTTALTAGWDSNVSFTEDVALGADEDDFVTVNAPVTWRVVREDFEGPNILAVDITNGDFAPSVADTEFNLYMFQNINLFTRIEVAFAGTNAPESFVAEGIDSTDGTGRVFLLDHATILDVVDNDAIEYNFGGDPTEAIIFYEDNSIGLDSYCEVSVRIDDISNVSSQDFYFGIFLAAAINDTFAFTASNTWAAFTINDVAGDLQICAEEDADTHGCDDAGVTWADNATHVLRVEVAPDAVVFRVNGTVVTATNAIMDADAAEEFVCRLGVRSAGTTKANIELNYVEIGKEQ